MTQPGIPWSPAEQALVARASAPVTFPGGPKNQPTQFNCDADRVIPAGGALASHLLSPDFRPYSRIYRKAVARGLYSASRSRPFSMVLGAEQVPQGQILALCGIIVRPYRFDSLAAGDAYPLEPHRLSLSLGYDLTVGVTGRLGNITAELIPGNPDATATPAYPVRIASTLGFPDLPSRALNGAGLEVPGSGGPTGPTGQQVAFQQTISPLTAQPTPVNPKQFVLSAAGAPQPLSPSTKQGPVDLPFTYLIPEGESVTISAVAFGPIRIPLSMIEGELTGYLLPKNSTQALLDRMRPCG